MLQRLRYFTLTLSLFLVPSILVLGQTCSAFLATNITASQSNCGNVEVGFACYGSGDVAIDYVNNGVFGITTDVLFTRPTDQVPLVGFARTYMVKSLTTANINSSAKINISAGLPVQLPETQNNATFILMGSARVESGTELSDALVLLTTPEQITTQDVTLFTAPSDLGYLMRSDVITTLSGSQTLQADGRSDNGQWVRVFHQYTTRFGTQRATAWVRKENITVGNINILPIITPDTYTSMQKAYTSADVHQNNCGNTPSGLMIESAQGIETELMINDMPMRVTGTVFVDSTAKDRMRVSVLDGTVILWGDQTEEEFLTGGQAIEICLTDPQSLGVDENANDRSVIIGCTSSTTI